MTGRVSSFGSSRWSRSVASPMISVTNQAPKMASASGSAGNSRTSPAMARPPTAAQTRRPPVDGTAGRMLLVVLRPAGGEAVRGDPQDDADQPRDERDDGQRGPLEAHAVRPAGSAGGAGQGELHERRV